jgi:hypothetical protein
MTGTNGIPAMPKNNPATLSPIRLMFSSLSCRSSYPSLHLLADRPITAMQTPAFAAAERNEPPDLE